MLPIIAGAAGGGVLLVILIIVVVLVRKRRQSRPQGGTRYTINEKDISFTPQPTSEVWSAASHAAVTSDPAERSRGGALWTRATPAAWSSDDYRVPSGSAATPIPWSSDNYRVLSGTAALYASYDTVAPDDITAASSSGNRSSYQTLAGDFVQYGPGNAMSRDATLTDSYEHSSQAQGTGVHAMYDFASSNSTHYAPSGGASMGPVYALASAGRGGGSPTYAAMPGPTRAGRGSAPAPQRSAGQTRQLPSTGFAEMPV